MRLLHATNLKVEEFVESQSKSYTYAILSHTWQDEEITFQDMQGELPTHKKGFSKLKSSCIQAKKDGYEYIWIDTCCIDKSSSAELSEAINSMYRWYKEAAICYAYLSDVLSSEVEDPWHNRSRFRKSRWFTRGWTLQELIAPRQLIFLSESWTELGTKTELVKLISDITTIDRDILLSGNIGRSTVSVARRMSWAARRITTRVEDRAYSLLGIFDVNMPLLYGEGYKAFIRLQEEILKQTDDESIFANYLPLGYSEFGRKYRYQVSGGYNVPGWLVILNCGLRDDILARPAIFLRSVDGGAYRFERYNSAILLIIRGTNTILQYPPYPKKDWINQPKRAFRDLSAQCM